MVLRLRPARLPHVPYSAGCACDRPAQVRLGQEQPVWKGGARLRGARSVRARGPAAALATPWTRASSKRPRGEARRTRARRSQASRRYAGAPVKDLPASWSSVMPNRSASRQASSRPIDPAPCSHELTVALLAPIAAAQSAWEMLARFLSARKPPLMDCSRRSIASLSSESVMSCAPSQGQRVDVSVSWLCQLTVLQFITVMN